MPTASNPRRRIAVLCLVVGVVLATLPTGALAAPVQGVQGAVTIEEGETVDGIEVAAGTVIVRGTVEGDVQAAAGSVVIAGTVTGNVEAGAGTVIIEGRVDGDVRVGTGSLVVREGAVVGGSLEAGAGSARVAGRVAGDSTIGAGTIVLEPTATFEGDLRYDGELDDRGATIEGSLVRDESLGGMEVGGPVVDPVVWVYGVLVALSLGAVLLFALPASSRRLAAQVVDRPLMTGVYGLVAVVGIPILLVLVALTLVGIPLALAGTLLFGLLVWAGTVFGRYAVGEWLLGYTNVENRWIALLVGVLVVVALTRVPFLGGVVQLLVLLLGLGGIVALGLGSYRRRRESRSSVGASG